MHKSLTGKTHYHLFRPHNSGGLLKIPPCEIYGKLNSQQKNTSGANFFDGNYGNRKIQANEVQPSNWQQ
jgi:hypothetical protein